MKYFFILTIVIFVTGCSVEKFNEFTGYQEPVGSPIHTKSLNATQIQSTNNYDLCKAATPRELYSPNQTILNEVARRGIDCRSIYQYNSTLGTTIQAIDMLNQGNQSSGSTAAKAFFKYSEVSGMNRICYYDRLGNMEAHTISSAETCPISKQRVGVSFF